MGRSQNAAADTVSAFTGHCPENASDGGHGEQQKA
jgi:hypothetical protein